MRGRMRGVRMSDGRERVKGEGEGKMREERKLNVTTLGKNYRIL